MAQRQSVADASAAVMANHGKGPKPEGVHKLQQGRRYASLGPARLLVMLTAGAVARQIRHHHAIRPGKLRGNAAPGEVSLGISVQQQNGRALAADYTAEAAYEVSTQSRSKPGKSETVMASVSLRGRRRLPSPD